MMIRIMIALVALTFAVSAHAEDRKPVERKDFDKRRPLDNEFLAVASDCAKCQCAMADLVEKRASRQEVKDFAKTMESDHKAMLKDLAKVIKNKKIAIVAGTNKVDKERCAKMSKLSGKEFEGSFFLNVVSDHEDAIAMYENQIENGKDEKVTAFAKEAVKKLREHLKEAKKLRS